MRNDKGTFMCLSATRGVRGVSKVQNSPMLLPMISTMVSPLGARPVYTIDISLCAAGTCYEELNIESLLKK